MLLSLPATSQLHMALIQVLCTSGFSMLFDRYRRMCPHALQFIQPKLPTDIDAEQII